MLGNTRGFIVGKPSPRKGKKSSKPAWNKGLKFPERTGKNNPRWKGGKTRDVHSLYNPRYVEWRKSVYLRDNWKCCLLDEDCEGQLEAHHILRWSEYPEQRYETNNGITLCHFHHPRKRLDEIKMIPIFRKIIDSTILRLNLEGRKAD